MSISLVGWGIANQVACLQVSRIACMNIWLFGMNFGCQTLIYVKFLGSGKRLLGLEIWYPIVQKKG